MKNRYQQLKRDAFFEGGISSDLFPVRFNQPVSYIFPSLKMFYKYYVYNYTSVKAMTVV